MERHNSKFNSILSFILFSLVLVNNFPDSCSSPHINILHRSSFYRLPCPPAMVRCYDDTKCILNSQICDGQKDCDDGLDETDCEICSEGQFNCDKTTCIPTELRCDRNHDCSDRSDEKDCVYENICTADQFMCNSTGSCILKTLRCNEIDDCPDRSDEIGCPSRERSLPVTKSSTLNISTMTFGNCTSDQFKCKNRKCVDDKYVCNGVDDCGDRSDERSCRCAEGFFTCANLICVSRSWVCDSKMDCPDGSDEKDCPLFNCTGSDFQCTNRKCVTKWQRCNSMDDCGDRSDEKGCSRKSCSSEDFDCGDHCIPKAWQCDGQTDCRDGTDEVNCTVVKTCDQSKWKCPNGKCIDLDALCNGADDCGDRSDEKNCTITRCGFNKFDCGKSCIPSAWKCDQQVDCENGLDEVGCPSIEES